MTKARGSPVQPGRERVPILDVKRTIPKKNDTDVTYWTANQWGMPGTFRPPGDRGRTKKSLHYTPHSVPWPAPTQDELAELHALEGVMRATLAALASFNDTERMVIVKQFRFQERAAQELAARSNVRVHSPPGLLSIGQFCAAWHNLSVKVSKQAARALFFKYGCDSEGLLPYEVFAMRLLTDPSRLLALEPQMEGPYPPGGNYKFKGKLRYRYCRKAVFPPTSWTGALAARSAQPPVAGLRLEFVYGYAGKDAVANNLFFNDEGKVVYYTAALGVVYDPATHTQALFKGHNDDIRCIAIHPNRRYVATGQVTSNAADGGAQHLTAFSCTTHTAPPKPGTARRQADREQRLEQMRAHRTTDPAKVQTARQLVSSTWEQLQQVEAQLKGPQGRAAAAGAGANASPSAATAINNNTQLLEQQRALTAQLQNAQLTLEGLQEAAALYDNAPYVAVWDSHADAGSDALAMFCRIDFPPESSNGGPAVSSRYIVALAFSPDGDFLAVVTADNAHTIFVYELNLHLAAPPRRAFAAPGHKGEPPQVFGVAWNHFTTRIDPRSGAKQPAALEFVSYGVKHIKWWRYDPELDTYQPSEGVFAPAEKQDVVSACFLPPSGAAVATGVRSGDILIWDGKSCCVRVAMPAHAVGAPLPSVLNGLPTPQGVCVLSLNRSMTQLVSGGADGRVMKWNIPSDAKTQLEKGLERASAIELAEPLETTPVVFRGLDCSPLGGPEIVVGTHRCDIHLIQPDSSYEPLIYGHMADVWGLAWHPSIHHHFATAADSSHVMYWNARLRQLIAKCSMGPAMRARALAFSPLGRHLAVGCADGTLKILLVDCGSQPPLSEEVCTRKVALEAISDVKYSPDGKRLITGSNDNFIDIFLVAKQYEHVRRCSGHSSYITHLDWSADSRVFRSSCGAYELLCWDATSGRQAKLNQRDTQWAEWTCVLGFDVMAVFPDYSDGTDVDALCRSYTAADPVRAGVAVATDPLASSDGRYVATGDDFGKVRLFNYPCVVEDAPSRCYNAHSSHVKNVRFAFDNRWLVSVGGRDRAVCQWLVDAVGREQQDVPRASAPLRVLAPPPKHVISLTEVEFDAKGPLGPVEAGAVDAPARDALPDRHVYLLVTVVTADHKGAGTSGEVYVELEGQGGKSKQMKLDNAPENFTRGKTDAFTVACPELGRLTKARLTVVARPGAAATCAWMLDAMHVAKKASRDDRRGEPIGSFYHGAWVQPGQPITLLEGAPRVGAQLCTVTIRTGDCKGAGTDANVSITLFTAGGASFGPSLLDSRRDSFERGSTDAFAVEARGLGGAAVTRIALEHDNAGDAPEWFVRDVVVACAGLPDAVFVLEDWIKAPLLRRELTAVPAGGLARALKRYQVYVHTGDVKGAGSDADITLRIMGALDPTCPTKHKLGGSKSNFERAKVDTFVVQQLDLGKLTQIEVASNNAGSSPEWFCEQVVIVDGVSHERFTFLADRWFDASNGLTHLISCADATTSSVTSYTVRVMTSDIKGAGTNANVKMRLLGVVDGKPVKLPHDADAFVLDDSHDNFERGKLDTFCLKRQMRVDQLTHLWIGHDSSGLFADWHLAWVEVDVAGGGSFYFNCDAWIAKSNKALGGKAEITLTAAVRDSKAVDTEYRVTVWTRDCKFAGTDAGVFIEVNGSKDGKPLATRRQPLASSKNDFERGQEDHFAFKDVNVGKMDSVTIGHDARGLGSDWALARVQVLNTATSESCMFVHDGWIPTEVGANNPVTLLADGVGMEMARYTIRVFTGDVKGAGTDARVFCRVVGRDPASGQEVSTSLMALSSSHGNFERNREDCFTVEGRHVAVMEALEIGHDNSGVFADWFLQHVEVVNSKGTPGNTSQCFVWDNWIKGEKGKAVNLVRIPAANALGADQRYSVKVVTSDVKGAGTDADVSIILFGLNGAAKTEEIPLADSADCFERNRTDEFAINLKARDLGDLSLINIGFATKKTAGGALGALFGAAWHLSHVEITHMNTGKSYMFFHSDWIRGSKQNGRVDIRPGAAAGLNVYTVSVHTSDLKGAGTDANVRLTLFGRKDDGTECQFPPRGERGKLLDNSANNWERGQVDVFAIQCPDLGTVHKLLIDCDGSGLFPDWHLEQVVVKDARLATVTTFVYDDWISKKNGLQKELIVDTAPQKDKPRTYTVKVTTSDERGAGTDASVWVDIHGSKASTSRRRLETSSNDFERGKTDSFAVSAVDLGDIDCVEIGHDGGGRNPLAALNADWHLASVEVVHPFQEQKAYFFFHGDWLRVPRGAREVGVKLLSSAGRKAGPTVWQVTTKTSDVRGAGTDADVFVSIVGDSGKSGEQRLATRANNFERAMEDVFMVKTPHIGEALALDVWHNNKGLAPAWHLASVTLTNTSTGVTKVFPANRWFDSTKGLKHRLFADSDGDGVGDEVALGATAEYTITTFTSDLRGSGTDANVFIELYGAEKCVGQTRLETAANNFERNRQDVFKITAADVGDVQRVKIWHDGVGVASAWHLLHVAVESSATGKRYSFPCNAWLEKSAKNPAGNVKELLEGVDADGDACYVVRVYTSDVRGAGTDGSVACVIFGDQGDTGLQKLESSRNDFERGRTDTFTLEAPPCGARVKQLNLHFAPVGLASAWHLDRVELDYRGETLVFPHRDWVSKKCVLELTPDRDGDGKGDAKEALDLVDYQITVITSDLRFAGTDADVFIELHGTKGNVGKTALESGANNFQRGRKDVFTVTASDVGDVTEVEIWHGNNALAGSDWHLQEVAVHHPGLAKTFYFPVNAWLKGAPGSAGNNKTLKQGTDASGLADYKIKVFTSDVRGAGTDGDVFVNLHGELGATGERELANSANNFERKKVDEFIVQCADIGKIERLQVRVAKKGLGAAWHLAKMEVINTATGELVVFPYNDWLDQAHGWSHDLFPDGAGAGAQPLVPYRVTTYTSDKRGAGTSANVFLQINGTKGFLGRTALESSASNFSRNQRDEFVITSRDLGSIESIVVGHDNSAIGSAWHLAQVEVYNPVTGESTLFPCHKWLQAEGRGPAALESCQVTLHANRPLEGGSDEVVYEVVVRTTDVRNGGTDANVFCKVVGEKGDSGPQPLENSANNFERGRTDTFFVKAQDVGRLQCVQMRSDGSGLGADWHLDSVEVKHPQSGEIVLFPFRGWFSKKAGLEHTLHPEGSDKAAQAIVVDYEVTVHTSDCKGAGTDAEVLLELVGEGGVVGRQKLRNQSKAQFERNRADKFVVKGRDVGRLTAIVLQTDRRGFAADWHVRQVDVVNRATGEEASFRHDDWVRADPVTIPNAALAPPPLTVSYKVTVRTSNVFGAGTDAPVLLSVYGADGKLLGGKPQPLSNSANNMERGREDTFFLDFPQSQDCREPITKVELELGRSATLASAWHLESLSIHNVNTGREHVFACGRWFSKKEGLVKSWTLAGHASGAAEGLRLQASRGANPEASAVEVPYRLRVATSNKLGAGTDAKVHVEFVDAAGVRWEPEIEARKEHFEKGCVDDFVLTCNAPLSEVHGATLWHDGAGFFANWHCDHLELTHLPSTRAWRFAVQQWVPKGRSAAAGLKLKPEVSNDVPLDAVVDRRPASPSKGPRSDLPPGPASYLVTIVTPDKVGATAQCSVTLLLEGEGGACEHVFLGPCTPVATAVPRGGAPGPPLPVTSALGDLGNLLQATLTLGTTAWGEEWLPAHVDVQNVRTGTVWRFDNVPPIWVKAQKPLSLAARVIDEGAGVPRAPRPDPWEPIPAPGKHVSASDFRALPHMQEKRGAAADEAGTEPKCPWKKFVAPYPADPTMQVTYYYNDITRESTYDAPPEYSKWERQYQEWLDALGLSPRVQGDHVRAE